MTACLFALSLLAFLPAFAAPAAKPDFTGEWTINLSRSEFANQPAPKKMVEKIIHKEPTLLVNVSEVSPLDQEVKQQAKYVTDGKETTNNILGNTVHATATWEGNELLIHSWSVIAGRTLDSKERWKLSEGAATLIVQRHFEGLAGKLDQVIVFDKH